ATASTGRPRKPAKSMTPYKLPRMLATPRYQGLVIGTLASCGSAITSPASASRISQFSPAQATPRRDCSTWAAVLAARRVASSRWKARRSSFAARAIGRRSAAGGDLGEELLALHRLHDVVPGPLTQAPDFVGLLALRGAQDDRHQAGGRVPTDRPSGLESV